MIRLIDIILAVVMLTILLPLYLVIALLLFFSPGGVFYIQTRVGKGNKDFNLYKFRTMIPDSDSKGLLTVGGKDPRITSLGYFLRKYKLDELPQLWNVLKGDMSFVGPRPEVRKYVDLYSAEQKRVLEIRPGITDVASLEYFNENELLATSEHPEELYVKEIMPAKINLNMGYIENPSLAHYFRIIFKTFLKIVS